MDLKIGINMLTLVFLMACCKPPPKFESHKSIEGEEVAGYLKNTKIPKCRFYAESLPNAVEFLRINFNQALNDIDKTIEVDFVIRANVYKEVTLSRDYATIHDILDEISVQQNLRWFLCNGRTIVIENK